MQSNHDNNWRITKTGLCASLGSWLRICLRAVLLFFLLISTVFATHYNCSDDPVTFTGVLAYDASFSYCELCGTGQIRLVVTNPSSQDMTDVVVAHDLLAAGLEYVPGSTQGGGDPVISGTTLTWSSSEIPALASIAGSSSHNPVNFNTVEIVFDVRSISGTEEDLVTAVRNVQAEASFDFCGYPRTTTNPINFVLPLREPQPTVVKLGRNVDAAQGSGSYTATVYGNINDDVIWRIQVQNGGLSDLQDLKFDDLMIGTNFDINYACPTAGEATAVANNDGVDPGTNCVGAGNTINDFVVDDPFGNPAGDEPAFFVDVPAGGSSFVYLVGKILNSCDANSTNTVSGVEWGCEVIAPDGGITAGSSGASPGTSSTTLSSLVDDTNLNITTQITGLNGTDDAGSRGLLTITVTNNTGGSVKNLKFINTLPDEYVLDYTFTPALTVTPIYGSYAGIVDTFAWTAAPNLAPATEAQALANKTLEFELISSTTHPDHADQFNMLRHGDQVVIEFQLVMVPTIGFDPYDLVANLDQDPRPENITDATDPDNTRTVTNQLDVSYEQFCNTGATQIIPTITTNHALFPEDMELDIVNNGQLIFILTSDPLQLLPLSVTLSNNGGHTADDYFAFVTFGATMDVVTAPANCSLSSNPPVREVWDTPVDIPANATVYECSTDGGMGVIAPGGSVILGFEVRKSTDPADLLADDLTFRADVVGEIRLSDSTPLWFPAPDTAAINNSANNYSLDGLRARVIGFNLEKSQVGNCNENNPPPASPDVLIQIGEECSFNIHTGGWFGFQTPGFTYIAVQNITVTDELPDGQGYVSSTDPYLTSDPTIQVITLAPQVSPPLNPLDEGWLDWSFNPVLPAISPGHPNRITVKDQWFDVNLSTRMLNDPVDTPAAPNLHAAISTNILNSTFQAVFDNSGSEEVYNLGPSTVGYPQVAARQVDLTVSEPNIVVAKRVCNETLYGIGTGCSNFVPLANDGDTQDSYIYEITLTNQASASGVPHAPAYNITATDILDATDLMLVESFASDGLDNDFDGLIDAADGDGEGTISDNVVENAIPATLTFSHTHSNALLQLNPGSSVTFYYRVDPDDSVAPLQQLVNSVTASYDSLYGDYGNQTVVQSANSTPGGARVYTTTPTTATVQILPLLTQPKSIINLSHTPASGPQPQPVSIGEEIEYELRANIPVANLRQFVIEDNLPAGISCSEAPDVDLDALPYSAAGFSPGGVFTPTCSASQVRWDFGDQELTTAPDSTMRFDFYVRFIARVDNTAVTNDGDVISNGEPATSAFLRYQNESATTVTINYNQHDIVVQEPDIILTKSFEVATTDAGDIITVTVTANNVGNATAYNLQIYDDLTGSNLTFLNLVGGTDPPDVIDTTTFGANQPVFSWNIANPSFSILPAASISFTYEVSVDSVAQPHEVLSNIIEASWASLPSQNTALNSSGIIDVDGSLGGMRTGAIPNVGDLINDYETTAVATATVPALTVVKTDLNPALASEIGGRKNYQIEITLPEGTTHDLLIDDNLGFSGISYVLENNAVYDISYTFLNIASINGLAPSESVFNAFPADNSPGSVVWNIGNVVTAAEDDITANTFDPVIRINYFARINNDITTDDGDSLQNSARMDYTNGDTAITESVVSSPAAITVTEPVLTAIKTFTNVTSGKLATDLPDAGDIIEYTIAINNSGSAIAYDLNVVDTLPADLAFDVTFSPIALLNAVAVGGFVPSPSGSPAGPLVWGRNNSDDNLDIPPGQTLVLIYRVIVATSVEPNQDLDSSVMLDWTSLNGASSVERNGIGCPSITAPDDYCAGPFVATLTVIDNNTIVKNVINDSYANPIDATLRIGDFVTYRLSLTLQEGRSRNVSILDTLPVGMAFVDVVAINGDDGSDGWFTPPMAGAGSNFSYAAVANNIGTVPQAGDTDVLSWIIGSVLNDPLGDTSTDALVIEYRAEVLANAGTPQLSSTLLQNTVVLDYVDVNNVPPAPAPRLNSNASITVLQPVIDTLTKTDRSGRLSGVLIDPSTDVMNYRLTTCNAAGAGPAYSLVIEDLLPMQHAEASIAGPLNGAGNPDVYIDGNLAAAGIDYVYTPPVGRGGTLQFSFIAGLNAAACIDIDYDIGFYADFGVGQVWNNNVEVTDYTSLPLSSGQAYSGMGPMQFTMHNVSPIFPPTKTLQIPVSTEATIGDEVVYQILLPNQPMNGALFDVTISDILDPSLIFVSATDISANNLPIINNTVMPNQVNLLINQIPAGEQVIIELRTRVNNVPAAVAGNTFNNMVSYTFTSMPSGPQIAGGSDTTLSPLLLVEPAVSIANTVANITQPANPPNAGDILRYTLTLTAAGGAVADNYSDAFDLAINDSLSLGLAYNGNVTVSGAGNTIINPQISGNGISVAQTLGWDLASGTADIDINEGTVVTLTYDVIVLDSVLANQGLINSASIQWTGQNGINTHERDGSGSPAVNNYSAGPATTILTTPDSNSITKLRITDTWNALDDNVRVGDLLEYELRLTLQEGTTSTLVLRDTLPQGLAFEGIVSVNGDSLAPYNAAAPFNYSDIILSSIVVAGNPLTGPSTVIWNLGDIVNNGDNVANDDFVIVYRARVLNQVHPQLNNITLQNSADFDYTTAAGAAPTENSIYSVTLLQPNLTVNKSAVTAGGDTILDASELVTYTVDITNNGTAPAYDTVLQDVIPLGMRNGATTITMVSTELVSGTSLSNISPAYDAVSGTATWDFDSGVADQYTIPIGDTLRVIYRVQADSNLTPGVTLSNQAQVQLYYSFDDEAVPSRGGTNGVREIYGPSNIATVTLTTPAPNPLLKEVPVSTEAAIGVPFTYSITVPDVPLPVALNDVRILDNLDTLLANVSLVFVSVLEPTGTKPWTPVNTGTATNLVIEDTTNGIDIPAGEQAVIEVTVMLTDTLTLPLPVPSDNVAGDTFINTADYTFNQLDNDNTTVVSGGAAAAASMTVVEPDLTILKSGPATMQFNTPATFTLDVQNVGSGPAWDVIISDVLPNNPTNPNQGGMCDTAPTNIIAQVSDGISPPTTLVAGTDYIFNYSAAPICTLTLNMQTAAARIDSGEILSISYDATLDVDSLNGSQLTNTASVTQWFSADTAGSGATGEIRTYPTINPIPSATLIVTVESPILDIEKRVMNVTTGQDPGYDANPGDVLRYTVELNNTGVLAVSNFNLSDELDRLNTTPLFEAGSLTIISVPPSADTSNTDVNGGVNSTGLLDIRNLNIDAAGGPNDSISIVFEATLVPVIASSTVVLNQAEVGGVLGFTSEFSDDRRPALPGVNDPTETLISSVPNFEILKTSMDLTGDPASLQPNDTLRYTISVRNIGNENSINTLLRDQIPTSTTYVSGTTTLNGNFITDPAAGVSALAAGMPINAPENTAPGFMQAVDVADLTNIATITFDVTVDSTIVNGTIISNQSIVDSEGDGSGPLLNLPSDDPGTPALDDPTLDIVGDAPALDSQKTVQILVDNGVVGQLDPGDTLRYTITISNAGTQDTTGVSLVDTVPANTTYVSNSLVVNGQPYGQPDGGVLPLIADIDISSADLTSPFPGPGAGIISAGQSAVLTFDVTVNGAATAGTIISNQGTVRSNEFPDEPTDADGNDANGDQPTVVVVGNVQLLSITKQVAVVGGGGAESGGQLEYQITVNNIGAIPATNVVITDDLGAPPLNSQITYVTASALLNGAAAGISYAASVLTADYSSAFGDLPPGQTAVLRFRVGIASSPAVNIGDSIVNNADVGWDAPLQTASASASITVGGVPGMASLNGTVWHNPDFNTTVDSGELPLQGWLVDVYSNNVLQGTVQTDANGVYQLLVPANDLSPFPYELRFRSPGSGASTASLGNTTVTTPGFTTGPQRISNIVVAVNTVAIDMNLPIEPNGVVYDSILRTPVAGATISMLNATTGLSLTPACFDDPMQQGQQTLSDGFYKFDINFSQADCLAGGSYLIQVNPPATGFNTGESLIIPPTSNATTASFNVVNCPGTAADTIAAPAGFCEVQNSAQAPGPAVPASATDTVYYLKIYLDDSSNPGSSQAFNNHIPLDPVISSAITISKTSALLNVTRSQLVPYIITLNNSLPVALQDIRIEDNFPAGFKYVKGSARLDGIAAEPIVDNQRLTWTNMSLNTGDTSTIKLLLIVGAGVSEGKYINRAQAFNMLTGGAASGEASATVRVIPDPTFDCSDLIGKVFDDQNLNGYQDDGEQGIAAVRLATARGLLATTDQHGRFHITCASVPNQDRGSNFILKLDERTLPTGYRLTTENPRVQRATRGKMIKFNFGAAIHRIVRLDLADAVFEPDSREIRPQWLSRIDILLEQLQIAPSILRLSYLADIEDARLVDSRVASVKQQISDAWQQLDCCYRLSIETEIFWRRGRSSEREVFDE